MPHLHRRPLWLVNVFFAIFLVSISALHTTANALISSKAVVSTEQVRAELVAHAPDGVAPGKTLWVGLLLAHQPKWHTYWKNSGDSGLPTVLEWELPKGVSAAEIAWPLPHKLKLGTLVNYGYEDKLLLPVLLTLTQDFKPPLLGSTLQVKLKANWLVCRTECIPQEGAFTLNIPLQSSTVANSADFASAWAAQPQPLSNQGSTIQIQGQTLRLAVANLPEPLFGKQLDVFPETPEVINPSAPWKQAWQGGIWTAELPLSAQRSNSPPMMPLVLTAGTAGWRTEVAVSGGWPAMAPNTALSPALQSALEANPPLGGGAGSGSGSALAPTFWVALLGALLGGLILNLMPCVFPVLAIKIVSFTRQTPDPRSQRLGGLAYTAGVVLSFVALGLLLLALRAAGEGLGWGFQLQNPWVVAALAALFTAIGLNLVGMFELGQLVPSGLASLQLRHPLADSFLTGVLAVAVASPCTAPFMGASLGFAVSQPGASALLIFASMGLGLALPYLLASFSPGLARVLPKPGAWMDTFRKLMAWPMFATVAWLVWVLGQQSGIDGAGALLALLVAFAGVLWALALPGRSGHIIALILIAISLWMIWAVGSNVIKTQDLPVSNNQASGWQPWSPGKTEALVAEGKIVFVDFTAAWCVSCQYNKKTTLANPAVLADFDARKVQLLRADWTRKDPAISEALSRLGRNGVPVYVFYKLGKPPVVLSEILSVSEVRQALAGL
jgi:thiol:disulfide interchange protein/DsbC/DsbD-like thiol-disulfide interchange protein